MPYRIVRILFSEPVEYGSRMGTIGSGMDSYEWSSQNFTCICEFLIVGDSLIGHFIYVAGISFF